jgi:RNA polymerase sigma-70 factor (ECF subfamily)
VKKEFVPGGFVLEVLKPNLIHKAQKADPDVVVELYERYQLRIFRYLYYQIGDLQTAEDLTSEVFIRMINALHDYNQEKFSFQAWLFRIARNLSIDHFRRTNIRMDVRLDENQIATHDDPLDLVEQGLTSEQLGRALGRLSANQRDVVIMRFVNGMSIREVAEVMNKSQDSIKGLQRRGLLVLREILIRWEVTNV